MVTLKYVMARMLSSITIFSILCFVASFFIEFSIMRSFGALFLTLLDPFLVVYLFFSLMLLILFYLKVELYLSYMITFILSYAVFIFLVYKVNGGEFIDTLQGCHLTSYSLITAYPFIISNLIVYFKIVRGKNYCRNS